MVASALAMAKLAVLCWGCGCGSHGPHPHLLWQAVHGSWKHFWMHIQTDGWPLVQGRRQDRCFWYALQFCKTPLRSDLYLLADADQVCLSVESSLFSCQVFIIFFLFLLKWIACSEWHGKRFLLWGTRAGGASLWVVFLWSGSVGRYLWAHHSSFLDSFWSEMGSF